MVMCIAATTRRGRNAAYMHGEYFESAAELAREHGIPPKRFRYAVRKAERSGRLSWREAIDGTRHRVLRGSDAHEETLDILWTLAGQARA